MIGEILGEIVSTAISDLFAPSTDRGRVGVSFVLSIAAAGCELCAFASARNPLQGPDPASGIMIIGVFLAIPALVVSFACFLRVDDHRRLSGTGAVLAGLALLWPLSLLM
jgi:hypothetical protein